MKKQPSEKESQKVSSYRDLADHFTQNLAQQNRTYASFLKGRKEGLQQITQMIHLQLDLLEKGGYQATPKAQETVAKSVIWDEADLLEFAQGSISKVFGPEFAEIDHYVPRVRLPMPPYLLVSRVTKLQATPKLFEPSKVTTEYDIPVASWYSTDGRIPWCVAVESGQCDLLLISYLGIDFQNKGKRAYRLLDCTLTFMDDLPMEGETLRYEISIDSFTKNRKGEVLLFFFSYDCYVEDKLFLKMTGGCASFSTPEELAAGKGFLYSKIQLQVKANAEKKSIQALLPCHKNRFSRLDLESMTRGDFRPFSPAHQLQHGNSSLVVEGGRMLMVDEILSVQPKAGAWGIGVIEASFDLQPDAWYFPCHFKDDEVMAGSLMSEACVQLLQFYLLYLGSHTSTRDAQFQPIPNLPQKVLCRGQVTPKDKQLIYRVEVREIVLENNPYAIADIEVWLEGRIVVLFENLGVQLKEKN